MLFSQLKRLKVMLLHLLVLCSAQHSAQPETHQVKGIVGTSLYFPVMVLKSGSLLYGDLGNIAQVFPGKQSNTNLEKRFKNRLHWNNVTGFFTLSDLRIEDSGVYTLENTDGDGEKMTHTFNLTVYYGEERTQDFLIIPVICVLIVLVLVGVAIYLKKRRNEPSQDSPGRKQDDIQYAEITHIKPAGNQEERTRIQGLDPLTDNPNLTSVYDTVQLHRMAASEDVNTS